MKTQELLLSFFLLVHQTDVYNLEHSYETSLTKFVPRLPPPTDCQVFFITFLIKTHFVPFKRVLRAFE